MDDADRSAQRSAAWQRLLDQPAPDGDREPDWEEVKDDLRDGRWQRLHPASD